MSSMKLRKSQAQYRQIGAQIDGQGKGIAPYLMRVYRENVTPKNENFLSILERRYVTIREDVLSRRVMF
jgi:hypothetical protein